MAYTPQTWADGPAGLTPITAARLAHIESGLVAAALAADNAAAALASRPQVVKVTTGDEARPSGSNSVIWLVTNADVTTVTSADPDDDLIVRTSGDGGADTTAPSMPTGVSAASITATGFELSWTASTDDVGVTGYDVQLDGVSVSSPSTNAATITGRAAATTYAVRVRARDAAGNWSALSTPVNVTTGAGGPSATHSIWGSTTPDGSWVTGTDGTPNIEVGNCFYRFGSGAGTYPGMRIVGGKIFKPAAVTFPAGTVTMRWHVNEGRLPAPTPSAGWGSLAASETVDVADLVNGWNTILLDTPIDMPPNAGVVVVTVQWNGNDDFYMLATGARVVTGDVNSFVALDGTKITWSETELGIGYAAAMFKIGSTYGATSDPTNSYGTDLLVDEGAA